MTSNKVSFKVIHTQEEPYDCDCCGTCYPVGLIIQYNGETVWERQFDGHMGGFQTESSILDALISAWVQDQEAQQDAAASEENRLKWNETHPGNAIASSPEQWAAFHNERKPMFESNIKNLRYSCQVLPQDETRQVKMIALWFEEELGESVIVEVEGSA